MESQPTEYAGFWMRFAAYFVDSIIISFLEFLIVLPLLAVAGFEVLDLESISEIGNADPEVTWSILASAIIGLSTSVLLITWFYYALLESGARQATIGKMVLKIKVTNANGGRISFARASLRYFSKILSSLFMMIGYIMAGFTPKKQALHDYVADTYVVRD